MCHFESTILGSGRSEKIWEQMVAGQHLFSDALGGRAFVNHSGGRHDEGEVVLALEALLDYVHVQHAQESTSEPETHRTRHLHFYFRPSKGRNSSMCDNNQLWDCYMHIHVVYIDLRRASIHCALVSRASPHAC